MAAHLMNLPEQGKALRSRVTRRLLHAVPRPWKQKMFHGTSRYCPVCESRIRGFQSSTHGLNGWCPICASVKRHRLVWLFLQRKTNLFDGAAKKMLHVAPEAGLRLRFEAIPNLDYLSADLSDPRCAVRMDITDIQYPDDTFDVIYCSHVLEHVQEDRKAICEFARVLKPDGWAVFMVPLTGQPTIEDPSITSPAERKRVFGQHDHVRKYGPDFKQRLETGFRVSVFETAHVASAEDIVRMELPPRGSVFYCTKNPGQAARGSA